jgi:rhamnogalacturonyl hydrolase YesR
MCKSYGGVGIPNLRDLNICLLGSWLKRYQIDEGKLWKQIIDDKYGTDKPNIFYSNTAGSSQFFKGMAKAAKMGYKWRIGNGRKV